MSNNPAMVLEIVGLKNLNTAYGLNAFIIGLIVLAAPPLHGMLSKEAFLAVYMIYEAAITIWWFIERGNA